jgi:DNA-binding transcriptional MerR regulator
MIRRETKGYVQVFLSADVSRIAGVSLRQLQWWDERNVISPRKKGHRRVYLREQVLEVLTAVALRRKGLSLQKIRRVLGLLRSQAEPPFRGTLKSRSEQYLLTDAHSVCVEAQLERVVDMLVDATRPMYVVSLRDQLKHLISTKG